MELSSKSYFYIKQLAVETKTQNLPVDTLLLVLSKLSASMCGDGNPNKTGNLLIDEKEVTSIMGANVLPKISEGAYGVVYKTVTGNITKRGKRPYQTSDIIEVAILNYLNHPNVLCLYGASFITSTPTDPKSSDVDDRTNSWKLSISLPLATTTLDKYDLSSIDTRKSIFFQLFRALEYIHSKHVWHLDIKPQNILIFPGGVAKLADFGISTIYSKPETLPPPNSIVTLWWRAPELLLKYRTYDETVDEWALGVMLLNAVVDTDGYLSEYDEPDQFIS